ncbi:MAG: ribonuclease III [Bdellovibrionales bacterium]|nr:ribonuclease III [Bdellovibrionales bacterium]
MASDLEKKIGHVFAAPHLLQTALTHGSLRTPQTYERLEFLGDRVLGLAVAALLYTRFPDETEGALAKRHTALVQQPALALLARGMGLSDAVRLSDGERGAGGADKDAILSDVLEALIGAVFMDAGYMAAHDFVARIYGARIEQDMAPPEDPKSKLQEWAQSRSLPLPVYEVTGQSGPDHAPLFRVSVQVKGFAAQEAEAQSKRAAEKAAAILLLQKIGEKS